MNRAHQRVIRAAVVLGVTLAAAACARTVRPTGGVVIPPAPIDTTTRPAAHTKITAPKYALSRTVIDLPPATREFRGVWIATVDNIDWPTQPGLSTSQQKAELLALLDRAAALHLNAVILQIRPTADAFYESDLEPWSRYLTGETGKAPDPRYDPLAFAVAEAHARGLELHAWFNPFRASLTTKQIAAPSHVTNARPDLVVTYGTMKWLDPGMAEARDRSLRVIADVVKRYDIDGVHLDDYFYPYVQQDAQGRNIPFPDSDTYARYVNGGGTLNLGDWRRDNINSFVHAMYDTVHRIKPWVQVGISPFGIWRPGFPSDVRGLDSYAEIYADARTWLQNGWVDYLAPQLYWRTDAQYQAYTSLVKWWTEQNTMNREMLFGNAPYRMHETGWSEDEIIKQIDLTRAQPGAQGNIYFSAKSFLRGDNRFADMLLQGPYQKPALMPDLPWLAGATTLQAPKTEVHVDTRERLITVDWSHGNSQIRNYLLRTRTNGIWSEYVVGGNMTTKTVAYHDDAPDVIALTAIGRDGHESPPATFREMSVNQ